ncbi:MAG: diadenylate cyclase CdaA [Trichlorobacter sp.]|jgi:uncharacterized protein (TIGR00159 family)
MPSIRLQDILDILIMSFLIYQLYSWFRRSRAIQVLAGLGVVIAFFFLTRQTGLQMTSWVLQQLETVLIVLVVVVFQNEIRQALYRFSLLRGLVGNTPQNHCSSPSTLSEAVFELAAQQTGAIIVLQRQDQLDEHLLHGIPLDAQISTPLLRNLFHDGSPLHDGAVLIRDERIAMASCLLPLSDTTRLSQQYGTRHRAALGLSEQTDAVVLVVSEERGEVSLAVDDELQPISDAGTLKNRLEELLVPQRTQPRTPLSKRLFSDLLPKGIILLGVSAIWLLLATRPGEVAIVPASLTFHNLPDGLALVRSYPEELSVRIRSTSGLAPSPRQLELTADLDLSTAQEGQNTLRIPTSLIHAPSGVTVVGVEPSTARIIIRKAPHKK